MGPNASNEKAVNRFAKAIGVTKQLMDNFDLDCKVLRRAGKHVTKAATRDQKKIIDELVKFDVFTKHAHREYKKFLNVDPSLLSNFNMNSMFKGHWQPKFLLLISIRYTYGIFNFIFWPVCRV